jgi:hypothetical protein
MCLIPNDIRPNRMVVRRTFGDLGPIRSDSFSYVLL